MKIDIVAAMYIQLINKNEAKRFAMFPEISFIQVLL